MNLVCGDMLRILFISQSEARGKTSLFHYAWSMIGVAMTVTLRKVASVDYRTTCIGKPLQLPESWANLLTCFRPHHDSQEREESHDDPCPLSSDDPYPSLSDNSHPSSPAEPLVSPSEESPSDPAASLLIVGVPLTATRFALFAGFAGALPICLILILISISWMDEGEDHTFHPSCLGIPCMIPHLSFG
jgi:hypothetical protein